MIFHQETERLGLSCVVWQQWIHLAESLILGSLGGHEGEWWHNVTHHFPYMSTGQTIKGLFWQEMSSIPGGCRRKERRGHENDPSWDLVDNVMCLWAAVNTARTRSLSLRCWFCAGWRTKALAIPALIKWNFTYTVNRVFHVLRRKETDVQYLDRPTVCTLQAGAG